MKSLIRLTDYTKDDVFEIFKIADDIQNGKYKNFLTNKTVVMFFPNSSIRTRVTFEKGIHILGGQTILFPPESLDKKESLKDVIGYLNNWANIVIVRHNNLELLKELDKYSEIPIINAMTGKNHPCEILSDMYSLSKIRDNFLADNYLFCGTCGNIGLTWKEASEVMKFSLTHCSPNEYKIENLPHYSDIKLAVKGKDIICTDSIPQKILSDFKGYQITKDIMEKANKGAILNPCPPFFRGEEVSADVIDSEYFVGYSFKKYLLEIQQAVMIHSLMY